MWTRTRSDSKWAAFGKTRSGGSGPMEPRVIDRPLTPVEEAMRYFRSLVLEKARGHCRTVLDFSCGRGSSLLKWAIDGCNHYIGIDKNPESIVAAQKQFKSMQLKPRDPCMEHAVFQSLEDICDFKYNSKTMPKIDTLCCTFSVNTSLDPSSDRFIFTLDVKLIQSEAFQSMVKKMSADGAFHDETIWIIYTERSNFEDIIVPVMQSLSFVCREFGGPKEAWSIESPQYPSHLDYPVCRECKRKYRWGLFQFRNVHVDD
jgi:hypothetical protein